MDSNFERQENVKLFEPTPWGYIEALEIACQFQVGFIICYGLMESLARFEEKCNTQYVGRTRKKQDKRKTT